MIRNVLTAGIVLCGLIASAAGSGDRKFVAFAWEFSGARPADLLKLADAFDQTALDGIGIKLSTWACVTGVQTKITHRDFMHGPEWKKAYFKEQIPVLKELTKHRSMKECFASSFHAPRTFIPWQDDAAWARIAENMRTVAWIAHEGGLRGLCIDPEDYKDVKQFKRKGHDVSYGELYELVRRRGREVFAPVFEEYPAVRLHFFWFLSHITYYAKYDRADVVQMTHDDENLWPAFLNGILDVMPPAARISDGDEDSYRYTSDTQGYVRGALLQKKYYLPLVAPENRAKYTRQVGYAPAVYLDMFCSSEGAKWYKPPAEGTRLERLRQDLIQATDVCDGYVWFWSESHPWVARGKKWKKPDRRIKDATWEEVLPGLNWTLEWVKDSVALYDRTVAVGTFTNLAEKTQVSVTNGYVTLQMKNVKGGEYYGVAYETKGASARVNVFIKDAQGKYVKPSINMIYTRDGRGIVRVPEGGANGTIVFSAENNPGEKTAFENIRVYRLRP